MSNNTCVYSYSLKVFTENQFVFDNVCLQLEMLTWLCYLADAFLEVQPISNLFMYDKVYLQL